MKTTMRRRLASAILASPRFALAARRLALDERFLATLLEDPVFLERVVGNAQLADSLRVVLLEPDVLSGLLREPALLREILDSPELFDAARALVTDDGFLAGLAADPAFLDRAMDHAELREQLQSLVVNDQRSLEQLLSNEETAQHLIEDRALFERLLEQWPTIERLAANPEFLHRLLATPSARETLMRDDSLVAEIVNEPRAVAILKRDANIVSQLLSKSETYEAILNDDALLTRLLNDHRSIERLVTDDILLTKFLSQQRCFEKLVVDTQLCTRFIYHSRAHGRILDDERLLTKLLSSPRSFEKFVSDDVLLTQLASHQRVFDKMLTDTVLVNRLVTSDRAIDAIVTNESSMGRLRNRLANDPGMLAEIGGDASHLEKLLADKDVCERIVETDRFREWATTDRSQRLSALVEFEEAIEHIGHFIPLDEPAYREKITHARSQVREPADVQNAVLDIICEGNELVLPRGRMRFLDRSSLWITLHEIMVNEEYWFECSNPAPRILDCGAHIGLATFYFKSLFPRAKVTAFEPVPFLAEIIQENFAKNDFADVELLPYALSDRRGQVEFEISKVDSMAGSLTHRRSEAGDAVTKLEVECRPLSDYLDEPVHFLKLDIEGSEDIALVEAAPKLANVQHLFVEYHHGLGLDSNRLGIILGLLDEAGFDVQVGKSSEYQKNTSSRAMRYTGTSYSALIWAKNRDWPEYR